MVFRFPRMERLIALVFFIASSAVAVAQDGHDAQALSKQRKALLDVEWQLLQTNAQEKVLKREQKLLTDNPKPALLDEHKSFVDPVTLLKDKLRVTSKGREEALAEAKKELDAKQQAARDAWEEANGEKFRAEYLAGLHRGKDRTKKGHDWDIPTSAILIWGGCLVTISGLLGFHGRRRQIRSHLRFQGKMGTVASAVILSLLGLFGFLSLASGQPTNEREIIARKKVLAVRQKEIKKLEEEVNKERDSRLERVAALFSGKKNTFHDEFLRAEKEASGEFRSLLCTAQLVADVEVKSKEILDTVAGERAELGKTIGQEKGDFRWNSGIKIGLCLAFVILAFLPLHFLEKSRRTQQAQQAKQCPCCLAAGSLEVKNAEVRDARFPEPSYLECVECRYELRTSYQKLPRLSFPTVGVPMSGKTHWMVTAYDLVKNSRVPVSASLQSAPSVKDQEFDIQIEQILEHHKGARATVHDPSAFPYPLVFHLKDCDRLGNNEGMLNLFDFSGEMMKQHVNTDVLRQRALLMDGFVLFLDPTKISSAKGGDSLKNQIQVLSAFHQEIRDMRGVEVGMPVPVPVAVCISKLDLLTTRNPLRQAAVPWIKSLRESFARPLSLAEIQKRSRLCEQVLPMMFPGWNLSRTLHEHFGGRFLFFPLTPVSLEEAELGQEDLNERTFAPVGILDPILWLLYMHGFNVFA